MKDLIKSVRDLRTPRKPIQEEVKIENTVLEAEDKDVQEETNAVTDKYFNTESVEVTEAEREFKNGDKVYVHDGDSWGREVHFEGIVIGYVGDKVKIRGTGQDAGKTQTSEEKFVALQSDFDDVDESVTEAKNEKEDDVKHNYDKWIDQLVLAIGKNSKRPEFVKAAYYLEQYSKAYPSTIRTMRMRSPIVNELFEKLFKELSIES